MTSLIGGGSSARPVRRAASGRARRRRGVAVAEDQPAAGEVVGSHLDRDAVADHAADAVLAHLARGVDQDHVLAVELHAELPPGEDLIDHAFEFERFFLGHAAPYGWWENANGDRCG